MVINGSEKRQGKRSEKRTAKKMTALLAALAVSLHGMAGSTVLVAEDLFISEEVPDSLVSTQFTAEETADVMDASYEEGFSDIDIQDTAALYDMEAEEEPEDWTYVVIEDDSEDATEDPAQIPYEDEVASSDDVDEESETLSGDLDSDDLFEEVSSEEEETDSEDEEAEEELTEEIVIEEPLVVNPESAVATSGRRRMMAAASAAAEFTCYGDQLGEQAKKIYDYRKSNYDIYGQTGVLEYEFEKASDSIYAFSAPVDENGTLDRASVEYQNAYKAILEICQSATDAYQYDFPQIFWTRVATYSLTFASLKSETNTGLKTYFVKKIKYTAKEAYPGAKGDIAAFSQAVTAEGEYIRAHSDYDKDGTATVNELLQGIHDYICDRCWYDREELSNYQKTKDSGFSAYNIFSAAGVFLDSVSSGIVCEGYARGVKVLCDYFGIPCACVGGTDSAASGNMGHMWNHVCLNGTWYMLDCTWDDQTSGGWTYKYFLVPINATRSPNSYISGPVNYQKISSTGVTISFNSLKFSYPVVTSDTHNYVLVSSADTANGYAEYACSNGECVRKWIQDVSEGETVSFHQWSGWQTKTEATCTQVEVLERTCTVCGKTETKEEGSALGHDWGDWEITQEPTCEIAGSKQRSCIRDVAHVETQEVPATGHTWGAWHTKTAATCTQPEVLERICTGCGKTETMQGIAALGHDWDEWQTTKEATASSEGEQRRICRHDASHVEVRTIPRLQTVSESEPTGETDSADAAEETGAAEGSDVAEETDTTEESQAIDLSSAVVTVKNVTWTGKKRTPSVKVVLQGKTLVKGTDYTLSWANNKNVGTATVSVKGRDKYTGSVSASFIIRPRRPYSLKKAISSGKVKLTWKEKGTVSGYQIQYARNKAFSKKVKTVSVKSNTKKKTLKSLTAKKTWYIRVRAWKTVKGVRYYSTWSKIKKVKP